MNTSGAIIQKELPIYGGSRLGVYNKQGTTQYQITDHLGNVRAVIEKINNRMEIADYADYYPFGEKLPLRNKFSEYRYAFQGQELDKETGMEAFQLRLWDGRIGRWLTTDPYGEFHSPYLGMGNNPVSLIDPDGGIVVDPPTEAGTSLNQTHHDPDTGSNYVWDGGNWHSDMAGGFNLSEVTGTASRNPTSLADGLSLTAGSMSIFTDILKLRHVTIITETLKKYGDNLTTVAGNTIKHSEKVIKYASKANIYLSAAGVAYSAYKIYDDNTTYSTYNTDDAIDATVGAVGIIATGAALISTAPILPVLTAGATAYGIYTIYRDVNNLKN